MEERNEKCCAVYFCPSNSARERNRRFYKFPAEPERCSKWVEATGAKELKLKTPQELNNNYYVCDLHFASSNIGSRGKLSINSIPFLNLTLKDVTNPTQMTQTDQIFSGSWETEDVGTQCNIYALVPTSTTVLSTDNIPANCQKGIAKLQHLADLQEKRDGHKFDRKLNLFALDLYFTSPCTYRALARTLGLPSKKDLRRMKFRIGTELHSNAMKCLSTKVKNLNKAEKDCMIYIGEMSLKPHLYYQLKEDKIVGFHEISGLQKAQPATKAFVIMARGLVSNWEQQIGYSLLSDFSDRETLGKWLDNIMWNLIDIGFNIVALVSHLNSTFWSLASERIVSLDKPYFYMHEKKIYFIYDIVHLVRSLRNTLSKHNFEYLDSNGSKLTAKWHDIQKFYSYDIQRKYRLAPRLTEEHIYPSKFKKLEVKTATEVFSKTVAAAMYVLIENGQLEGSAIGTVKLINLIDKTLDAINSSVSIECKSDDVNFASFLSTVTVRNKNNKNITKSVKFLKGFKVSLESIKFLARELQAKDYHVFQTEMCNPLDVFFKNIWGKQGRKPTPMKFVKAFNKAFKDNLLETKSSEQDYQSGIEQLMKTAAMSKNTEERDLGSFSLIVDTVDYRLVDLPENNAFLTACGYLINRCFKVHKCRKMCEFLRKNILLNTEFTTCAINPSKEFIDCIRRIDDQLKCCFEQGNIDRIGNQILAEVIDIAFVECCACFPNEYMKRLYVRFRIYHIVQYNNRLFKDSKRKCFYVPDL